MLPRIWSRARTDIAATWERRNTQLYMYSGAGKGAEVAGWKQAARVELAAAKNTMYAQRLLDLVKAHERIPRLILLREAIRLGDPIWLPQLAVATCRLLRVIRVEEVVSPSLSLSRPRRYRES